jgi:hypothetical protein
MKKSRAGYVALSITVMLAVMCTAESCDDKKVKKAFQEWNYKAGEMTVACNEAWDEIYQDVQEKHTQDIIDEHGADPEWTDEMAAAEYEQRMAEIDKHNERIEDSMAIIGKSLLAMEQSLDAADHIDDKLWVKSIRDILNAIGFVEEALNEFAMNTDNEKFNAAVNWIGVIVNGGKSLLDLLGAELDPNDPADD